MSCVHWLKANGVCKHCGYTQPAPSLGLTPRNYRDEEKPAPQPDPLRAGLVAIKELHKELTVYEWDDENGGFKLTDEGEMIVISRLCSECTPQSILDDVEDAAYDAAGSYDDVPYPCPTRRLADDVLGGGQDG